MAARCTDIRVPPFTTKGHPTRSTSTWITPYLQKHLDAIEADMGVSLLRTPNHNLFAPLGYGVFGVAFATSDGRVLKITTDNAEPVMGVVLRELQNGPPSPLRDAARGTVVLLDDIKKLPGTVRHQGCVVPVYGILREDITPVSDDADVSREVREALHANYDGWERWLVLDKRGGTKKAWAQVAQGIWDGWEALDSEPAVAEFALLQRHLWNLGIPLMDTHRHNFGWREGAREAQLVLFDIGGGDPLKPKHLVDPIDGDAFERYFPWDATLQNLERA